MKNNLKAYVIAKLFLVLVLIIFYFSPSVFEFAGYGLSIDGVVICRGLSLIVAIYILSSLFDKIYQN